MISSTVKTESESKCAKFVSSGKIHNPVLYERKEDPSQALLDFVELGKFTLKPQKNGKLTINGMSIPVHWLNVGRDDKDVYNGKVSIWIDNNMDKTGSLYVCYDRKVYANRMKEEMASLLDEAKINLDVSELTYYLPRHLNSCENIRTSFMQIVFDNCRITLHDAIESLNPEKKNAFLKMKKRHTLKEKCVHDETNQCKYRNTCRYTHSDEIDASVAAPVVAAPVVAAPVVAAPVAEPVVAPAAEPVVAPIAEPVVAPIAEPVVAASVANKMMRICAFGLKCKNQECKFGHLKSNAYEVCGNNMECTDPVCMKGHISNLLFTHVKDGKRYANGCGWGADCKNKDNGVCSKFSHPHGKKIVKIPVCKNLTIRDCQDKDCKNGHRIV
jgi:hypothetical protein